MPAAGVVTAGCEDATKRSSRILSSGGFLGMPGCTTSEVKGVVVVAFEASDEAAMDWQSSQRDWLYKLIESHPGSRFAIDLTDVPYLASSQIGVPGSLK